MQVATGGFITERREDVRFAGTTNAITFSRHHTSLDGWPRPVPRGTSVEPTTRLSQGWMNNFDERLFADDARSDAGAPSAGATTLEIVRRTPTGSGQRFSCPPPHDPAAGPVYCDALDGSTDRLVFDPGPGEWQLRHGDGVWMVYGDSGVLLGSYDRAGHGWAVTYHASGTLDGLIDFVQDHFGRRLYFVWEFVAGSPPRLLRLEDAASNVLASYAYTDHWLTGATSKAGSETYTYLELPPLPGHSSPRAYPFLTQIVQDGAPTTEVTYYVDPATGHPDGRVRTVSAATGDFEFRMMDEAGSTPNLCNDRFGYDESRTAMVIDRSVPEAPASCTSDLDCSSEEACSGGFCRQFTCQQYVQPTGSGSVSFEAVGDISGNCACGGAQQRTWAELSNGAVRVTSMTERDGTVTTYAHDTEGRLTERCVGDADGDGDPGTCSSAGAVWTSWTYHPTYPDRVTLERRRSRLSGAGYSETEYEYDEPTGRLRFVRRRGYTRDLSDTLVGPVTETTEYRYDASGRLSEQLGPQPGQRTVYTYYAPSPTEPEGDMLHYVDRYVDATTYLRTTYGSYTYTGLPTSITDEAGVATSLVYNAFGQLQSSTVAGRTTSYAYDAAGRLQRITEPSGRRQEHFYDGAGRLERLEIYDSPGAGQADRVRYDYDAAGRRTAMHIERIDSSGGVIGTTFTWTATYDNHGFRATDQVGPQLPTTYTYDPDGLGYLQGLTRGDGDPESYGSDLHGRATSIQRTFSIGLTGTHALEYGNAGGSGNDTGGVQPTRVTTPASTVRDYVYDDFGRLVRSDSTEWGTARWRWTNAQLSEELRPDGKRTAYTYDSTGRVTLIDRDADNPSMVGQDYQFDYDNGDAAVPCVPSTGCSYRVGRLARVGIEHSPGVFWSMYYDYDPEGRTLSEVYPDGREAVYEYDSAGRLERLHLPALPNDALRYDYDPWSGDAQDPEEITQVTHERSGGDLVYWARDIQRDSLGRVTEMRTHDDSGAPAQASWNTDGRLGWTSVYRRDTGYPVGVIERYYGYSADGTTVGYQSVLGSDPSRTFFYDMANRLTCAANVYGAPSCPEDSTLVESYGYDTADNRISEATPAGGTTINLTGNVILNETGLQKISYGYTLGAGGPRDWDNEEEIPYVLPRQYVYDGAGRLSGIDSYTADPLAEGFGEPEHHVLTILYDHRSRPLMVVDDNVTTGLQEDRQYFWAGTDLLQLIHTPDAGDPTTYDLDTYVPLQPMLLGRVLTQYEGGKGKGEEWMYYATGPLGQPVAGYSFDISTLATSEVWRMDRSPFGERLSETTYDASRYRPPHLFPGQFVLPGSEVGWWNEGEYELSRAALWMNMWRVYDARVGQYLQPEPLLVEGSEGQRTPSARFLIDRQGRHVLRRANAYQYALSGPGDYLDADGRCPACAVGAGELIGAAITYLIVYAAVSQVCEGDEGAEASLPEDCVSLGIDPDGRCLYSCQGERVAVVCERGCAPTTSTEDLEYHRCFDWEWVTIGPTPSDGPYRTPGRPLGSGGEVI